jgi:hypothetical protein
VVAGIVGTAAVRTAKAAVAAADTAAASIAVACIAVARIAAGALARLAAVGEKAGTPEVLAEPALRSAATMVTPTECPAAATA